MTAKVLVSACLVGRPVRYDGESKRNDSEILERWQREGRVVIVCPEVAGGLAVPRPAAEIVGGDGADVLRGDARVETEAGTDVSAQFVAGANIARRLVAEHGIRVAVLKERSPSCGGAQIYDGSFSGQLRDGAGVTAVALREAGVEVFGESELSRADAALRSLDEG